jgi:predicted DCC family thiol-disulfide oxidoreductase YuxK
MFSNQPTETGELLLYDGLCGFCNGFVRFILKRDRRAHFRFAPLESPAAARRLAGMGVGTAGLPDSLILITDSGLAIRSAAALLVLARLGPFWRLAGRLLALVPTALRDRAYDLFARHRYRIFGCRQECAVPNPAYRPRFLWD